jgi:uncharacterized protein (DUF1501 family)
VEDFGIPELAPGADQLEQRRRLLSGLDSFGKGLKDSRSAQQMQSYQEKAFELLSGSAMQQAFRIGGESESLREAYGRDSVYGQRLLLARRLVEAGTRLVCIAGEMRWDTHFAKDFADLKGNLLPDVDAALASLLADLAERGLLERTLVVVMGEFGRTPRIEQSRGGRDHWSRCYSVLLAGGGIKRGYVHGSSDKIGATPKDNPLTPADLVATIYQCLGIPFDLELRDAQDRPSRLVPWGEPVTGLLT